MNAADVLRSLPPSAGPVVGKAAAVTTTVTAALIVVDPSRIVGYLGACVAVYGPAAAIALYRTRPGRLAAEDAFSDLYDDIDGDPCESCEARPAVRSVIAEDGETFSVCDDCTPGPVATPKAHPLQVVR
jgi:hypothetical protein